MSTPDFPPREPSPGHAQSAEFRERQWESQQRGMRVPALLLLGAVIVLMALSSIILAVMSAVLASVLGIGLVIGRGNVLVRCGVTLLAAWVLARIIRPGDFTSLVMALAVLSAMGTCVCSTIVSHLGKTPSRWAQFSIGEMGSYLLALGVAVATMRDDVNSFVSDDPIRWEKLVGILAISGITVLASLPVLVPRRYRQGGLFLISAGLVLVVMPLLLCSFLHAFRFAQNIGRLIEIPVIFWMDAALVWALLFTLETAGAFRDDVEPRPTAAAGEETLEGVE